MKSLFEQLVALTQGRATIAYPMFAYRPKKNIPSAFTASGGEPI